MYRKSETSSKRIDMSNTVKMLELKYSHNIIEHLGLKLYQNKPTNVIAELVSNAWDAYAKNAYIDISQEESKRFIAIADDGFGMTYEELLQNYLVIGKHKRHTSLDNKRLDKKHKRYSEEPDRSPMGRKGIGKLAPFGIASLISLISVSCDDDGRKRVTWIRMNLKDMIREDDGEITIYRPEVVIENERYSKESVLEKFKLNEDGSHLYKFIDLINQEAVEKFCDFIGSSGTLLLLNDLSLKNKLDPANIINGMGRRFTVTLLREDFTVKVNGTEVNEASSLPKFEHRIPLEGMTEAYVEGKIVKYWVGFVKNAEWPSDEAGIGVFAHGKIAQERPFTFGSKGREIFTRYMYGVVEADWLDELDQDLISTDRTNINWDAEELSKLGEWGKKSVGEWVKSYREASRIKEDKENVLLVQEAIREKKFTLTESEQKGIAELLSEIAPSIGKDIQTKKEVINVVSDAWTHKPMRKIIKNIWDQMQKSDMHERFVGIVEDLNNHLIPESLSLAVTFAQRTYALSLLHDLVHNGREVDLQKLIEEFPWILEQEMGLLSSDISLKRMIDEAETKGHLPRRAPNPGRGATSRQEPDFVYLADGKRTCFVVVEIKNPRNDLIPENRTQIFDYMDYIESKYPKAEIAGILIGTNTSDLQPKRNDLKILSWTEILINSRSEHLSLLGSIIRNSEPSDARVADVKEFGGDETWELLHKMAEQDDKLKALMEKFDVIAQANSIPQLPVS